MSMKPFKKLSEEIVWESQYWRHIRSTFELPDGSHQTMEYPGGVDSVMMFAVNDAAQILTQSQYRPFIGEVGFQVPAGKIDEGESVEVAAQRELAEESGYNGKQIFYVGKHYPSPGFSDQVAHVFVMSELFEKTGDQDEYELEHAWKTPQEFDQMIADGIVKDGAVIAAWTLAKPKVLELIDSQS